MNAMVRGLVVARRERLKGATMLQLVDRGLVRDGRDVRQQASAAMDGYEGAVRRFRGAMVRSLVEEGNLSLTEVARRMGVSRQAVARLYQTATGPAN